MAYGLWLMDAVCCVHVVPYHRVILMNANLILHIEY